MMTSRTLNAKDMEDMECTNKGVTAGLNAKAFVYAVRIPIYNPHLAPEPGKTSRPDPFGKDGLVKPGSVGIHTSVNQGGVKET